jgi:hypothetical protein
MAGSFIMATPIAPAPTLSVPSGHLLTDLYRMDVEEYDRLVEVGVLKDYRVK